ncbi:DUF1844 domain-containing protein [Roseiconus nitratireducens]|uniref:DUF1844 domain-containing protein n=1 Tax=Roseiconus nitratireducens TaxID=2605748 RepID=A0A5M6DAJ6_9BACT|nr:DUF1844 domain-containing protein [Roseiconus nitratireducens]KAA5544393.1 DUF1844 domain-containing protein [Roseiconus nitratireducens]
MTDDKNEPPELVVDDDWKSQVEKEKQAVSEAAEKEAESGAGAPQLPPASLEMLISTFYSQAMMALGVMPNPSTGEKESDLMMAKHMIDTLEMLEAKTKGNTNDDESKMFDEVLHLLRMAYVGASKQS